MNKLFPIVLALLCFGLAQENQEQNIDFTHMVIIVFLLIAYLIYHKSIFNQSKRELFFNIGLALLLILPLFYFEVEDSTIVWITVVYIVIIGIRKFLNYKKSNE